MIDTWDLELQLRKKNILGLDQEAMVRFKQHIGIYIWFMIAPLMDIPWMDIPLIDIPLESHLIFESPWIFIDYPVVKTELFGARVVHIPYVIIPYSMGSRPRSYESSFPTIY